MLEADYNSGGNQMNIGGMDAGCSNVEADWTTYGVIEYPCGIYLSAKLFYTDMGPAGQALAMAHAKHHRPGHRHDGKPVPITDHVEVDETRGTVTFRAYCDCKIPDHFRLSDFTTGLLYESATGHPLPQPEAEETDDDVQA